MCEPGPTSQRRIAETMANGPSADEASSGAVADVRPRRKVRRGLRNAVETRELRFSGF
jgi:hypothetical protein